VSHRHDTTKRRGARPGDLGVDQALTFLRRVIPPPPARILDAGCGQGDLAGRLAAEGYQVTALDSSSDAVRAAREAGVPAIHGDFLDHREAAYDAVLFIRSLHHMHPLPAAVARASELLRTGGVLVAVEFARERADRTTASWFYDVRALLRETGLLEIEEEDAPPADPLERWRADHLERDGHPLHTGGAMMVEIMRRFEAVAAEDVPYLYWYLARWLRDTPQACGVARRLLEIEIRRIAAGMLAPVGWRLAATLRGA
jgi:SAM-dependent methyltransferase